VTESSGRLLRRDLGVLESYAAMIGILVGAGIFKVTTDAWQLTGASVILGYVVLAPAILATSIPYAAFLSTPLGREPGGEYTHISRTLQGHRMAFIGAWLKIISFLGALGYLAIIFSSYLLALIGESGAGSGARTIIALSCLLFFYVVHAAGVRWFGRLQVFMCALLGVSLLVLIVPGIPAVRFENYTPFFSGGVTGFLKSLPLLFFAYAGFEAVAQTAGEVENSTRSLPRVFVRGILVVTTIYILMSVVTFGVLPGQLLRDSQAPMADVAAVYLPAETAWIITLGALMAIATSLNASMLVPSRLMVMLVRDGLAPSGLGGISSRTGTPVVGLTLTLILGAALIVSSQLELALNIAVSALVVLYFIHSAMILVLERRNPELFGQVASAIPVPLQRASAWLSLATMGGLIAVQIFTDLGTIAGASFSERASSGKLTSLELLPLWGLLGFLLYRPAAERKAR